MEKIKFKISHKLSAQESGAFEVVKNLQVAGYEAYIAGGAVRDFILERPVHDIDIATSARPDEIKKLMPKTYDRGKAFGVVALKIDKNIEYEIATFRTDIGIADHRRPVKVEYTTAEIDAQRRDFTINGLFYDPTAEVIIDYVDGMADIKNKIIRFIGDPQERIDEDYLRILRAIRFSSRLNFTIDPESKEAICKNVSKIIDISAERIREELTTIITSDNRIKALKQLEELSLLKVLLPEIVSEKGVTQPPEFHSEGDVYTHTLLAMESLHEPKAELAWTVLLHDVGKPQTQGFRDHPKSKITFFDHDAKGIIIAEEILKRLKFSNEFIDSVTWAISQHMRIVNAFRGMSERKQKKLFTHPHIDLLLDLTKADLSASIRPAGNAEMKMYKDALKKKDQFEKEIKSEEGKQIKKFTLITGRDIMEILHIPSGPRVGEIKKAVEESFLEGKVSTKDEAIKMVESYR